MHKENHVEGISKEELLKGLQKINLIKGKEWFLELCKIVWRNEEIPKDLERNILFSIHKNGDEIECGNGGEIYLISTTFKVYIKIAEERIKKFVEHKFIDKQVAFRKGRKTTDNMFILCIVLYT